MKLEREVEALVLRTCVEQPIHVLHQALPVSHLHFLLVRRGELCALVIKSEQPMKNLPTPSTVVGCVQCVISVCISVCITVCITVCNSVCNSVYHGVCITVCISVCSTVCNSVCNSVSHGVYHGVYL